MFRTRLSISQSSGEHRNIHCHTPIGNWYVSNKGVASTLIVVRSGSWWATSGCFLLVMPHFYNIYFLLDPILN